MTTDNLLSFAQQRLWFLDQLTPGASFYNIPVAVRMQGWLDAQAFARSLNEIVNRHEALRTTFPAVDGQPTQSVAPTLPLALPVIELREFPQDAREAQARLLAAEEARRPFNLATGPLLRATLLRLGEMDHVALLTMHHIVSDAWSIGVLLREVAALYEAYSQGRRSPLDELPIQYADYAVWQREWLSSQALEKQLAYWRRKLAGLPVLDLPTDHPRPAMQTYRGATESLLLPAALTASLKGLSQRNGVTLFMTLLAAFQTLLMRHAGQEDVIVGSPVVNRGRAELEGLIGLFVNMLPLRTDLSGDPSFVELLRRVRGAALGAYAHQDLPFERLVEELQPERDLSRHPLFQVMMTLQNAPGMAPELPGLKLSELPVESATAKFDLALSLAETETGLAGSLEYSADLFEAETVRRMLGHYRRLLESVVADPRRRLSEQEMLTEAERERLLMEWNRTGADYPRERCVHELFERQVELTPERMAVTFDNEQLSYAELNRRANQLARHLRELGVGPETRVGVCMERSLEMVISLLGTLKAGGAYAPLDPDYPEERLAYMVRDAGGGVLLTEEKLLGRTPDTGARIVCLDTGWEFIASLEEGNLSGETLPENLAYVIYTSGSTGQPKGVQNTHRGLCNRLIWMQEAYQLGATDRVMQKTPFSFDVSVWEFFWPLLTGACLVVARPEGHKNSAYLAKLIEEEQITTMHFVPSMLAVFLGEEDLKGCGSLKNVICSGEALPYHLMQEYFDRLPGDLHNLYGPTEAAIDVTFWKCSRNVERASVPIGRPIANTQVYVLNERLEPAPIGVRGEVYLGGDGLARGYLHRPGLTAEKFVPNLLSRDPGTRLYRTGDVGQWRPDGNVEYLGRTDHQVKLRGFRIELGEIESALADNPNIREAVVVVRKDLGGGMRLAAYIVPNERSLTTDDLRGYLRRMLPDYMIPSVFVTLDALPLTPNGKINRRALPSPRSERTRDYIAPRTAVEEVIAISWAEALGVERVGVHDDFLELGGHSLLLTRLASRLQEAFRMEIPIRTLFELPTVAQQSEQLEALGRAARRDVMRIAQLLITLNQMSDTEVRTLLASKGN